MNAQRRVLKDVDVLRALQRGGWIIRRVAGAHYSLVHADTPGRVVTVPFHRADLKPKTLASILVQAGLTREELDDLL